MWTWVVWATVVGAGPPPGVLLDPSTQGHVTIPFSLQPARGVTAVRSTQLAARVDDAPVTLLDVQDASVPLDVVVLLDVSGSMSNAQRNDVLRAMETVALTLGPEDRFGVATFNRSVKALLPLGARSEDLERALSVVQPAGGTHIRAAVNAVAAQMFTDAARRKAILLISDALEGVRFPMDSDGFRTLKERGVALHMLIWGASLSDSIQRLQFHRRARARERGLPSRAGAAVSDDDATGHPFMAWCQKWGASLSFFVAGDDLAVQASRAVHHMRQEHRATVSVPPAFASRTLVLELPENVGVVNVKPPSFDVEAPPDDAAR